MKFNAVAAMENEIPSSAAMSSKTRENEEER